MDSRKQMGNASEAIARQYLEQQNYVLQQSNFQCRAGEIDLIMRKDKLLVFVEVRSRSSCRYGMPSETVSRKKQDRIRKAAAYYLYQHPQLRQYYCRFDVISVVWQNGQAEVEWLVDAFQ